MSTRTYTETGDGWRLRATKSGYNNAQYEITSPPKKRMDRYSLERLEYAIARARVAMGEKS